MANLKSSELGMAQDYWVQAMTLEQRMEVMAAVGYSRKGESIAKYASRCYAYVFENHRDAVISHQKQLLIEMGA